MSLSIRCRTLALALTTLLAAPRVEAADGAPSNTPPPVPVTRRPPSRRQERSKQNQPRLPLPPLTAEEKAKADQGDWSVVNNGRMRSTYLPAEFTGAGFTRQPDPGMTLGYPFQTMIFWVVSRGNNCTYCLGHQESKLAAAGVTDETIAALDGDWASFTAAERAAFALAKKLTYEPHTVSAADIERLRPHYNDNQILEILLVTGNFNAMNRWTGALRIPQEDHRVYVTAANDALKSNTVASHIAPLATAAESSNGGLVAPAPSHRPALESRAQVEAAIEAAVQRAPRIALADESAARAALPEGWNPSSVPQWARLLATFPKAGGARIALHHASETAGQLDHLLAARIAWTAARHDRAWYALADARRRLHDLGQTDDQIFALDQPAEDSALTPADRAALALARKVTTDPAQITDADVEAVRKHFSDHKTAEVIWHATEAAFFNRVTEAAGLQPGK
ncbi:MAG: carboxymuconolactone decarboxylase family protein [Isosphaeraceae bacterium]